MEKCFFCKTRGEIGINLCKHKDKDYGLIIVCYDCHKKRHSISYTKK